jgi:uncharacterized membrane protein HdeD (DUF308 family)
MVARKTRGVLELSGLQVIIGQFSGLRGPIGLGPEGEEVREMEESRSIRPGMPWWLFLITGIAWLMVSLVVLRFDVTSLTAVGVLLGVVLIAVGVNEFFIMSVVEGWKWVHAVLGVLFVAGGLWAFTTPIGAFWELASILGFLLVFKGTMDIVAAVITRPSNELWWLGLTVGILEVLLAFWASQQFFAPRAALILLWVGFAALMRGITEIVLAFQVRRINRGEAALAT